MAFPGQTNSLILLRNGILIDGTGRDPYAGQVLISGDRIASIERQHQVPDAHVIDCSDQIIAPGFIDIHSHSDLQVLANDRAKTDQGVTTEVVGNCGFSPYPFRDRIALHNFANGILCGEGDWGWKRARDYLDDVQRRATLVNVLSLVGHGTLRVAANNDIDRMEGLLHECLSDGSAGLSTGLMYAPGSSAPREELVKLLRVVARHGKTHATHMRSYSHDLLESIEEQLDLARESCCRLQISHLQTVGRGNWDKQDRALEMIEEARHTGVDVEFDSYPYLAGSTVLTQLLPQQALENGVSALLTLLENREERKRIEDETVKAMAQQWSDIFISSVGSERNRPLIGKTIHDVAQERGQSGIQAALDLLIEENAQVNILSFNQSETNLRKLLSHPLCSIISDGFYVKGRPHPRLYGTFPCLLGEIVREKRWLNLAQAIHKVTDKPARRFDITHRGRLQVGYAADLVVFDPQRIAARATYEDPASGPVGITAVFRNGKQIT